MSNDAISRSAALEIVDAGSYDTSYPSEYEELIGKINDIPALDVQPVVRCKDCRYWRQEIDRTTHWVCVQHSMGERLMYTTPDFYCADGKRMDAEENEE